MKLICHLYCISKRKKKFWVEQRIVKAHVSIFFCWCPLGFPSLFVVEIRMKVKGNLSKARENSILERCHDGKNSCNILDHGSLSFLLTMVIGKKRKGISPQKGHRQQLAGESKHNLIAAIKAMTLIPSCYCQIKGLSAQLY